MRIHRPRARIQTQVESSSTKKDWLLFFICICYLSASTASAYVPPLFALLNYLLLAHIKRSGLDWAALAIAFACTYSELLHGFYAFGGLISLVFIRVLILERLLYKLAKKELLICVLILSFYALELAFNAFICYVQNESTIEFSPLFLYYASFEAAVACVFFKDIL